MSNLDLSLYRSIEALADNDIPNPILRIDFFLHAVITGEECNIEPVTKTEEYLYALATGDESRLGLYGDSISLLEEYLEALRTGDTSNLREPRTREEIILYQAITGEDLGVEPVSRIETYLSMLQNAGGLDYILSTSTNASVIPLTNSINGKARVQEMCGNTLVNLWDFNKIEKSGQVIFSNNKISATTTTNIWSNFFCLNVDSFKPSTIYTIITNVTKNTLSSSDCIYITSDSGGTNKDVFGTNYVIGGGKTGVFKFVCTTLSDFTDVTSSTRSFISNNSQNVGCEIELSLIILEGDWTNREIPSEYFEGMKSCGQDDENGHKIEILSQNKNLCPPLLYGSIGTSGQIISSTTDMYSEFVKLKENTKYICSNNGVPRGTWVNYYDKDKKFIKKSDNSSANFTTPNGIKYVRFCGASNDREKFQVELGTKVTSYVPHKSNKKEIQLPQPLRGLPNGVRDRIVYLEGKNLFNGVWNYNQGINSGTGGLGINSARNTTDFIPVKPNCKYVLSNATPVSYAFYDVNKEYLSMEITSNKVYVTDSNTYYIRINCNNTLPFEEMQLEEGEIATSYEPYAREGKGLYLEKNVGEVVLSSSHDWVISANINPYGFNKDYSLIYLSDKECNGLNLVTSSSSANLVLSLSDRFPTVSRNNGYVIKAQMEYIHCECICIKNSRLSTRDFAGFKKWLDDNPTTMYYTLRKPTYTKISDVNFKCYENATVYVDSGAVAPTKTVIRYPYKQPALFSL